MNITYSIIGLSVKAEDQLDVKVEELQLQYEMQDVNLKEDIEASTGLVKAVAETIETEQLKQEFGRVNRKDLVHGEL